MLYKAYIKPIQIELAMKLEYLNLVSRNVVKIVLLKDVRKIWIMVVLIRSSMILFFSRVRWFNISTGLVADKMN